MQMSSLQEAEAWISCAMALNNHYKYKENYEGVSSWENYYMILLYYIINSHPHSCFQTPSTQHMEKPLTLSIEAL